jgi:hypothetical protein
MATKTMLNTSSGLLFLWPIRVAVVLSGRDELPC